MTLLKSSFEEKKFPVLYEIHLEAEIINRNFIGATRFRKSVLSAVNFFCLSKRRVIHASRVYTLFVLVHSPLLTVIPLLLCRSPASQPAGRITTTDTYLREARPVREPSLRQLSLGRSEGAISASPLVHRRVSNKISKDDGLSKYSRNYLQGTTK